MKMNKSNFFSVGVPAKRMKRTLKFWSSQMAKQAGQQ